MHPALLIGGPLAVIGGVAYYFRDKLFGTKEAPAPPAAPKAAAPTLAPPAPPPPTPAKADSPSAPPVSPVVKPPEHAPVAPPPPPADAPIGPPDRATVTTNDPPPSGDLKVMSAPSTSGEQWGGVDKNGVVDVIQWNAGDGDGYTWSYIRWGGGRNAATQGYVKQKYLKRGV